MRLGEVPPAASANANEPPEALPGRTTGESPPAPSGQRTSIRPKVPSVETSLRQRQSPGGPGGGGKGPGGSGGGPGRRSPIEQRLGDREFKQVLGKALSDARHNLVIVGLFSIVVNTLVLAVRSTCSRCRTGGLTSRSTDTLAMLSIIVMVAIAAHVLLDMMRRFILMRVAVDVESRLGAPVLAAAAKAAQSGSGREFQVLADLQQIRSFLTGPVILTMSMRRPRDLPAGGLFDHPNLGYIVTVAAVVLFLIAYANQQVTAFTLCQSQRLLDTGQHAGRGDVAECPGHQRHGHDPRKRPDLGAENGGVAQGSGQRPGSQQHDDRPVEVLSAGHTDRDAGLGEPGSRSKDP